ncbi:seleno protein W family protein [Boeremia exigua]|uniref:seleno protein W family protein n=1 Tax=Boeremia exigua TaxID=749465 RepID=UPI001E8E701B|nr:seleno protein W family protein [Boeremia exigua]KAH6620109.1 seleno protein W family protein [Boeremia exigua]
MASTQVAPVNLPRVAITYCTQCRWMLRAAYFGQELLSTFGTQIGEIALIPATGGLFQVELTYIPPSPTDSSNEGEVEAQKILLWDRKSEGGFPETKVLKQRVRDHIDPKKDLGHSDVGGKKKEAVKEEKDNGPQDSVDVKVDGKTERNAEEMVKDMELEDVPDKTTVKRNPDGTVCEDCS